MHILLADDDNLGSRVLKDALETWDHQVEVAPDGETAWKLIDAHPDRYELVILDWMMPGISGVDLARRIREAGNGAYTYIIILTARGSKSDIVEGFESGADDYVMKPFNFEELKARIAVGRRIINLERALARNITELKTAISQVRTLQGLLPICSYCKKIRNDKDYWFELERYISDHVDVRFSHGICPDCMKNIVEPELEKLERGDLADGTAMPEDTGQ